MFRFLFYVSTSNDNISGSEINVYFQYYLLRRNNLTYYNNFVKVTNFLRLHGHSISHSITDLHFSPFLRTLMEKKENLKNTDFMASYIALHIVLKCRVLFSKNILSNMTVKL